MERLYLMSVCIRESIETEKVFQRQTRLIEHLKKGSTKSLLLLTLCRRSTRYELCNIVMSDLPCSSKGGANLVP